MVSVIATAAPVPPILEDPAENANTSGEAGVSDGTKADAGTNAFGTAESFCHRTFKTTDPTFWLNSIVIGCHPDATT